MQVAKIGNAVIETAAPPAPLRTVEGKFLRALEELDREEKLMDGIVRRAMKGGDFSPQELIAVQAGVYRYTQQIDLFGKLVDRAAASVRQLLTPQ